MQTRSTKSFKDDAGNSNIFPAASRHALASLDRPCVAGDLMTLWSPAPLTWRLRPPLQIRRRVKYRVTGSYPAILLATASRAVRRGVFRQPAGARQRGDQYGDRPGGQAAAGRGQCAQR